VLYLLHVVLGFPRIKKGRGKRESTLARHVAKGGRDRVHLK